MKVEGKAYSYIWKQQKFLKESFMGDAVTPFVGRYGYPEVNVGIMSSVDDNTDVTHYDNPEHWASKKLSATEIVQMRIDMLHSRFKQHVKVKERLASLTQEVGLAKKPFAIEVELKKKPSYSLGLSSYHAPLGAVGQLERARATENPKISAKVERIVNDDLRAVDQAVQLYNKELPVHFIARALSVGTLGKDDRQKLVPTRWSITAVDDTVGKALWEQVLRLDSIDSHEVYYGEFQGNYFLVVLIPGVWGYELFEIPAGFSETAGNFTTDFEQFHGRKTYADECAGGYYAARLGLLEMLSERKKQGRCLVFRWISSEYKMALGVWVVREAVRSVMKNKPLSFSELGFALKYAQEKMKRSWGVNGGYFVQRSELLKQGQQMQLLNYV